MQVGSGEMPAQYTCIHVGSHVKIVGSWCAVVVKGRGFCLQLSWEVSPLSSSDGALCPGHGLLMLGPCDLILSGEFKHIYIYAAHPAQVQTPMSKCLSAPPRGGLTGISTSMCLKVNSSSVLPCTSHHLSKKREVLRLRAVQSSLTLPCPS